MIRPLGNYILIRRLPTPDRSEGGLYVLGRELPQIGQVLAIGPGRKTKSGRRHQINITPGDQVAFDKFKWDYRIIEHEGEQLLLLDYADCYYTLSES